jgi:hypothetical protein
MAADVSGCGRRPEDGKTIRKNTDAGAGDTLEFYGEHAKTSRQRAGSES